MNRDELLLGFLAGLIAMLVVSVAILFATMEYHDHDSLVTPSCYWDEEVFIVQSDFQGCVHRDFIASQWMPLDFKLTDPRTR